MPKKSDRYKKLPAIKGKKVTPAGSRGARPAKLSAADIAEGEAASEKIAKRPTSDFSRDELSALMQTAPGEAEPRQIKTQSRQFRRVSSDMPESVVYDKVISPAQDRRVSKPMSAKTPKIDPED
jgi:hypothetical protein